MIIAHWRSLDGSPCGGSALERKALSLLQVSQKDDVTFQTQGEIQGKFQGKQSPSRSAFSSRLTMNFKARASPPSGPSSIPHSAASAPDDEVLIATTKRGFYRMPPKDRRKRRTESSFFQGEAFGRLTTSSINLRNFRGGANFFIITTLPLRYL